MQRPVARFAKRILVLAVLGAACVPVGCGGGGDGQGDELRVYVSHSMGSLEDLRAYQLALREEGDEAGEFKLKIVALSSQVKPAGTPTQASVERNARRAAADKRAIAYLGDGSSGMTVFSMPVTNRAGLLHICPSCTYVGLTRKEGALPGDPERLYPTGKRHFLHVAPGDHLQAEALVEYLQREDVDRVAILHDGQQYGKGLGRLVARAAPQAGITLTSPPRVPRGDIRREARRAAADGAGALMMLASGDPGAGAVNVMRRAAKAAPGLLIFAGDSQANPGFAAATKDVGDRFRMTGPPQPEPGNAAAVRFTDRFTKTYGTAPFPNTYLAYEAMRRVIEAARAAGDSADERSAIIRAIFAAPEEDTIVGRYRFAKNGESTLTTFGAYSAEDGKLSYKGLLGVGAVAVDPSG